MDGKRMFVQHSLLLQRFQGQDWAFDAITSAVDGHIPIDRFEEMSDDNFQSFINEAYTAGDVHRWAQLCEVGFDRMDARELHVNSVATMLMAALFEKNDHGRPFFKFQENDNLAEIAAAVFDLAEMVVSKAPRG